MKVPISFRRFLRAWCPPVIADRIRPIPPQSVSLASVSFQGDYPNWQAAVESSTGYDSELILRKVLDASRKVKRGEAAFERDSVTFSRIEYWWPSITALMSAAAMLRGQLRVVDFGGSLGSTYFQYRKLLTQIPGVSWLVVEQSHFVEAGAREIADDRIAFVSEVPDDFHSGGMNLLHLSGVLHYLKEPHKVLKELLQHSWDAVLIDRTPLCKHLDVDRLTVQTVPEWIYSASYPAWFFCDQSIRRHFESHYEAVLEWPALDTYELDGRRIPCSGVLYRRIVKKMGESSEVQR